MSCWSSSWSFPLNFTLKVRVCQSSPNHPTFLLSTISGSVSYFPKCSSKWMTEFTYELCRFLWTPPTCLQVSRILQSCPSGTSTARAPAKRRGPTRTSTCTPSPCSTTHSARGRTSWCCARRISTTSSQLVGNFWIQPVWILWLAYEVWTLLVVDWHRGYILEYTRVVEIPSVAEFCYELLNYVVEQKTREFAKWESKKHIFILKTNTVVPLKIDCWA